MIKKLVLSVMGMLFLAVSILLFMNISAFAADSDYKFDVDTGTITGYTGNESNIVIPSTIAGFPVTRIGGTFAGSTVFGYNENLTSVVINNNIKEIGRNAFARCSNLKNVIINADEITLGRGVFNSCKNLTTVNISGNKFYCSSSDNWDDGAFSWCSELTTVTLPNGFEEIPYNMFGHCSKLTNVFIPDSVIKIGENAFQSCSSLKNISLPDSITEIGAYAFNNCGLESISIPSKVKVIEEGTFFGCRALKDINFGNVESIGYYNFSCDKNYNNSKGLPIEELTLPATLKEFSLSREHMENLKKITILNDNIDIILDDDLLPKDIVIYCGNGSSALKEALSKGIKYVIIQTNTVVPTTVTANTAKVSSQKINIDGVPADVESYNIGGNNYFKLRDIAYIMNGTEKQFDIVYDISANSISLISNSPYTADGSELKKNNVSQINASSTSSALYYENQSINMSAYNINGNNYFKLRDIASLINFAIVFDQDTNTVYIMSDSLYLD